MIEKEHPLPITKQCDILKLSRSSLYYIPAPASHHDRELMRIIDEIHLEEPYLGSRGMRNILRLRGYTIGRIHVRTLMRKMGIEAIYRKPHLSKPHPGHTVYPYLLRNLAITEANSVWCSDITYIPMARGILLPRGHYGLGKQKSIVLEVVKHIGRVILRGRPGRGA